MTTIELLQQVGLNKYEAEAYSTLLSEGSLTGYELGKRSQVPLSRSYEILERLVQKGLALVQPGDPPRYAAQEPEQFLGQARSSMTATLDALAAALAALPHTDVGDEFWVLRGRQHILARARTLIEDAQQSIYLSLPPGSNVEVDHSLALARAHGCSVFRSTPAAPGNAESELILLLVDGRRALAGMLASAERCQAVVSANSALVTALSGYFARQAAAESPVLVTSTEVERQGNTRDWVAWEESKQQRLWSLSADKRIA